jgi:hypothetical protein
MATKQTFSILRGEKMKTGRGWKLVSSSGNRAFKATLVKRIDVCGEVIAIFRVLPVSGARE